MKSFRELQTEATKQTKKGVIAKAARKGTPPYTVVVLDRLNKVVKQETTQVADAVPAFVHELQKRYPKGDYKISVEDKGGSRVYSEEVEMEEGTSASQRGEPQTPHTQKQYDALSPKDKKLVDARVKAARKQSDSRNPSESPRNYKKRKPKTRRGGVSKYGRGQAGPLPKNEDVNEGTWELPDTPIQKKTLEKLMSKPLPVGSDLAKKYKNSAAAKLYSIIGDDELFDDLDDLRQKKGEKADARPVVKKAMNRLGIKEGIDEGIVILPKRSSRGGDVKEVGKDKRGGKTQYWWRHKNGLKNVYDSLEKLRYALRNDANFKDAEEITKQLGEAVNEAIWNKRMSDIEKSREFINPSGSKDLVKWLNTNTRLKVDKFQRDRKLKHDKEQDKIKGRSAVNSKVRNAARSIQIKKAQKKARKKDGFSEEIVDEGGMGRMKDPHTIRYVDPKQKDTTNISVVDGEREAKKFLAKVKKKGMSGTIKKGSEQPGSIQTVKYNQSTDQLNKASRYDTLTGKRK